MNIDKKNVFCQTLNLTSSLSSSLQSFCSLVQEQDIFYTFTKKYQYLIFHVYFRVQHIKPAVLFMLNTFEQSCKWIFHLLRNTAVDTVEQELLFVGTENGKLLAMRDIIKKVGRHITVSFVSDNVLTIYNRLLMVCLSLDYRASCLRCWSLSSPSIEPGSFFTSWCMKASTSTLSTLIGHSSRSVCGRRRFVAL